MAKVDQHVLDALDFRTYRKVNDVWHDVNASMGREVSIGALYVSLVSLEEQRYVEWRLATLTERELQKRSNRPAREYKLTEDGLSYRSGMPKKDEGGSELVPEFASVAAV